MAPTEESALVTIAAIRTGRNRPTRYLFHERERIFTLSAPGAAEDRRARPLEDARKSLEAALGRPPSPEEMAERLGVTLADYYKMLGDATAVSQVSLNKKWYETDSYKDVREIDILEDKKAEDPTHKLQNRDLMRLVTRGLNRNERLIIILYYYEDMTMKEIGATLDLSESRVSQMHSSIVSRLQAQLAKRHPEFGT